MKGLDRTMERLARQVHRRAINKVWRAVREGDDSDLGPQERKLFLLLREHTEYARYFEDESLLDGGEFPLAETVNPFLHISLHQMMEDQLAAEMPVEAALLCESLEMAGYTHHEAVHIVMMILIGVIFESMRQKQPFDQDRYIRLLKACRKLPPAEIGPFLERQWDNHS